MVTDSSKVDTLTMGVGKFLNLQGTFLSNNLTKTLSQKDDMLPVFDLLSHSLTHNFAVFKDFSEVS